MRNRQEPKKQAVFWCGYLGHCVSSPGMAWAGSERAWGRPRGCFLRLMPSREMLAGTWIDKAEPWVGLGIEKEIWEPAA